MPPAFIDAPILPSADVAGKISLVRPGAMARPLYDGAVLVRARGQVAGRTASLLGAGASVSSVVFMTADRQNQAEHSMMNLSAERCDRPYVASSMPVSATAVAFA